MIGIDIISIPRMKKFYKKHGIKGYNKFLRKEEIELTRSPKTAAGFWCLKEATSKALGCGIGKTCSFYDIWIHKNKLGKPYITLSKHLIEKFGIKNIDASISHDGNFAIGVVNILGSKTKVDLSH
ncbi:MAG: holo-ACP synthase [Proteobacteria bacterium]|nr:MAG: holo-ACP synthase [Pseudomonadota bacterium]